MATIHPKLENVTARFFNSEFPSYKFVSTRQLPSTLYWLPEILLVLISPNGSGAVSIFRVSDEQINVKKKASNCSKLESTILPRQIRERKDRTILHSSFSVSRFAIGVDGGLFDAVEARAHESERSVES
jgi:hypothetical protein